jgi:uncharacterized protein
MRGSGLRRLRSRQDFCASATATIRLIRRAYTRKRRTLAATKSQLERLIGNTSVLRQLEPEAFTDAVFGVPTVTDILRELEEPGRNPRPAFKTASFREGVEKLEDLKPGMAREGVYAQQGASFAKLAII